jgi:chromosome segregation ATPase
MTHELADWARAMLNYNSEEYDPEMVINKLLRHDETVSNLQRDLSQRTSEYAAKVDEVIRLEREIAALRYQVQNQTLRADDAVAAIEVWKRDFAGQRERIGVLQEALRGLLFSIDYRLNDYLREMNPEYYDSINGFNEAGNVIRSLMQKARASLGREGSATDGTPSPPAAASPTTSSSSPPGCRGSRRGATWIS